MYFNSVILTQEQAEDLINAAIDALVDGAPDALNTLNELAAAMGDDENFASTVTLALSKRARLDEANTFTVGGHVVTAEGATVIPLVLQGADGQTANLFLVRNSAGTSRFSVSDTGYTSTANIQTDGGLRVGTAVTYSTNQRWIAVQNAASAPVSPISSGSILFAEDGQLRAMVANGSVVGLTARRVAQQNMSYTLSSLTDQSSMIGYDSTINGTFTIPIDTGSVGLDFPVGAEVMVGTLGGGHLTVAGASGVTLRAKSATLNQQYDTARLVKIGPNEWFMCKA
jgi:hypothetical protein